MRQSSVPVYHQTTCHRVDGPRVMGPFTSWWRLGLFPPCVCVTKATITPKTHPGFSVPWWVRRWGGEGWTEAWEVMCSGTELGRLLQRDLGSVCPGQVAGAGPATPTRATSAEDMSQDAPAVRGNSRQAPPRQRKRCGGRQGVQKKGTSLRFKQWPRRRAEGEGPSKKSARCSVLSHFSENMGARRGFHGNHHMSHWSPPCG